jgi:hypothetical protein
MATAREKVIGRPVIFEVALAKRVKVDFVLSVCISASLNFTHNIIMTRIITSAKKAMKSMYGKNMPAEMKGEGGENCTI